jgi:hypothetical protein
MGLDAGRATWAAFFAHSLITKPSLTETHTISSTPLAQDAGASSLYRIRKHLLSTHKGLKTAMSVGARGQLLQ